MGNNLALCSSKDTNELPKAEKSSRKSSNLRKISSAVQLGQRNSSNLKKIGSENSLNSELLTRTSSGANSISPHSQDKYDRLKKEKHLHTTLAHSRITQSNLQEDETFKVVKMMIL